MQGVEVCLYLLDRGNAGDCVVCYIAEIRIGGGESADTEPDKSTSAAMNATRIKILLFYLQKSNVASFEAVRQ